MTDACHTRREIKSALLCEGSMRLVRARARWLPDRKIALVGKVSEVTFECGVVPVGFATGENMNRQHRERQIDEYARPSDVRRADSKKHRDSEDHYPWVEQRAETRAPTQRGEQPGGSRQPNVRGKRA